MRDIERICTEPDEEDARWFPAIAGNGDPWGTLREVWAEYRDESLVRQFLGPKVMRHFRMVNLTDKANDPALLVTEIHDDIGYRRIRSLLADQYDPARAGPLIEATDVDLAGDRSLKLTYLSRHKQRLHDASARADAGASAGAVGLQGHAAGDRRRQRPRPGRTPRRG